MLGSGHRPHDMKSSPTKPSVRTESRATNSSRLFSRQSCRRELQAFAKPSESSADKALPLPLAAHVADTFELEAPVHARSVAASEGRESIVEEYDVLGLGQLMVDYAAAVDDCMLATLDVPKGGRRVISVEERAAVMERLQAAGCNSQVSAGGSLANSLVGIAQLAGARERFQQQATGAPLRAANNSSSSAHSSPSSSTAPQRRMRVGMIGCCGGSDALGEFGRAQMTAAGVDMITIDGVDMAGSATGTVMVFTTPDAQRSFLSSFSSEDKVWLSPELLGAVAQARLLVIEGYLWELPGAAEVIPAVVKHARAVGTLTVLTAGDASVVQRHGEKVLGAIQAGIDMFVSNVAEAQELQKFLQQQPQQAEALAQKQHLQQEMQLHSILLDAQGSASLDSMWEASSSSSSSTGSMHAADGSSSEGQVVACELAGVCPLVVVTDGSRGSYITALGQLIVVPPYWRSHAPVDTCGAGDAYCSGFLFAFLLGLDLHAMGHIAAKTASAVISRHGPQLLSQDADAVAGAPLGRCSSLATQFMGVGAGSNRSSSTSLTAMQLQSLGLSVGASVEAGQLLQGASQ